MHIKYLCSAPRDFVATNNDPTGYGKQRLEQAPCNEAELR